MDVPNVFWVLVGISGILALALVGVFFLYKRLRYEQFRNKSLSTKYGKLTEQFLPLVKSYPWNPSNFRFLGSPIDGVQFEDDQIILVEFKAGQSRLSRRQEQIRKLVESGKVDFRVIRVA